MSKTPNALAFRCLKRCLKRQSHAFRRFKRRFRHRNTVSKNLRSRLGGAGRAPAPERGGALLADGLLVRRQWWRRSDGRGWIPASIRDLGCRVAPTPGRGWRRPAVHGRDTQWGPTDGVPSVAVRGLLAARPGSGPLNETLSETWIFPAPPCAASLGERSMSSGASPTMVQAAASPTQVRGGQAARGRPRGLGIGVSE